MQRKIVFALLAFVTVAGVISCGRSDKSGITIPKDAAMVLHINTPSLSSKLSWQEIKQTDWFKQAYTEAPDSLTRKLMDDPENSGIDTKAGLTLFLKQQGRGGLLVFEGTLKSADAFIAFNKNIKKDAVVTKDGDYSHITLQKDVVATWTGTRFLYVLNTPFMSLTSRMFGRGGGGMDTYNFSEDSLKRFGNDLLNLSGSDNLMNDDRFADLMKESGDLHFWVNSEQYYNSMGSMLSALKLSALFENNASASTVSFDDGKITMKSKQYFNKDMRSLLSKYPDGAVTTDLINRIPSQNVVAAFAMQYPPKGLQEFLGLIGVDGMVNGFLGKVGYSMDEFVKANKGDLLIAVTDLQITPTTYTIPDPQGGQPQVMTGPSKPDAKVLFATSINDKPSFDKLIEVLKSQIPEEASSVTSKISFQSNKDWFAAGNSPEMVNKFLAGGNSNLPFASKISGHAAGFYVDIQKILKASAAGVTDSSKIAVMNASLNMWQDVIATCGGEKGGAVTGEAVINLVDKNTNSLKQLNQYADKIAAAHKRPTY